MKISVQRLTGIGVMTALYVAATLACAPLAYGQVQFRVSEILMLFCFLSKDYIVSMTLGCIIVNFFSPLGMVDVVFGTAATLIAALLMYICRGKLGIFPVSLFPVITNGVIVGAELTYLFYEAPFWVNAGFVALGEFVCVSVLGVIVMTILMKNKGFMHLIGAEEGARAKVF